MFYNVSLPPDPRRVGGSGKHQTNCHLKQKGKWNMKTVTINQLSMAYLTSACLLLQRDGHVRWVATVALLLALSATRSSAQTDTSYGNGALANDTTGALNSAFGFQALNDNTTGSYNVALGINAGYVITTGNSNIDIGNVGVAGDDSIIRIGATQTATYLAGTVYANGVALTSDRNTKENFSAINAQQVLAKVAALPVTEWNYKTDSQGVQHNGPMAQDFQAAFQLSADDKHISVVDEGGVALAAIQGLNQKLETQIQRKDTEIAELKARLDKLEQLIDQQNSGTK